MLVVLYKYIDEGNSQYWIQAIFLLIPAVLTAAAGYVVNDIYDVDTDSINKPDKVVIGKFISKNKAWVLYGVLNILSLVMAIIFDNLRSGDGLQELGDLFTLKWLYFGVDLVIIILLFLYAFKLKGTPLIGNVFIALCSSAVIATCGLLIKIETNAGLIVFFGYIVFSFIISLIRELVKDMQDLPGDKAAELNTYPVVVGIKGSKILVYTFCFLEILLCGIYSFIAWGIDLKVSSILMGLVTLALFYFLNIVAKAKKPDDFGFASKFLKYIMFVGVLNLPLS